MIVTMMLSCLTRASLKEECSSSISSGSSPSFMRLRLEISSLLQSEIYSSPLAINQYTPVNQYGVGVELFLTVTCVLIYDVTGL